MKIEERLRERVAQMRALTRQIEQDIRMLNPTAQPASIASLGEIWTELDRACDALEYHGWDRDDDPELDIQVQQVAEPPPDDAAGLIERKLAYRQHPHGGVEWEQVRERVWFCCPFGTERSALQPTIEGEVTIR